MALVVTYDSSAFSTSVLSPTPSSSVIASPVPSPVPTSWSSSVLTTALSDWFSCSLSSSLPVSFARLAARRDPSVDVVTVADRLRVAVDASRLLGSAIRADGRVTRQERRDPATILLGAGLPRKKGCRWVDVAAELELGRGVSSSGSL